MGLQPPIKINPVQGAIDRLYADVKEGFTHIVEKRGEVIITRQDKWNLHRWLGGRGFTFNCGHEEGDTEYVIYRNDVIRAELIIGPDWINLRFYTAVK